MKSQSIPQKINNAFNGIVFTFKTESNFRFHCYSTVLVFIVYLLIQPSIIWWALTSICIGLVIAGELANTAIEVMLDHLHPEIHPAVGHAKDVMAGMVLILSFVAAMIGLLAVIDTLVL